MINSTVEKFSYFLVSANTEGYYLLFLTPIILFQLNSKQYLTSKQHKISKCYLLTTKWIKQSVSDFAAWSSIWNRTLRKMFFYLTLINSNNYVELCRNDTRLFRILEQFMFTTNDRELDYNQQKVNMPIASWVTGQLKADGTEKFQVNSRNALNWWKVLSRPP